MNIQEKLEALKEALSGFNTPSPYRVGKSPTWSLTVKSVKRCKYKPSMGWTGRWK